MTTHRAARPRIDREDELALIDRLVRGETRARVLLIQAASGMGKSELLREFRARCPGHLPVIVVDFKGGGLNLADVLFHICDTLGWRHFLTLAQTVREILRSTSINVSGNLIVGQNEISIASGGPDEQTRDLRRSRLTAALVDDLRALGRAVLIFDVYERCDAALQDWFSGVFLPAAHRSPQLAVIVAGQQTPEPTQMWDAEFLPLEGIAPEHWQEYAHAVGTLLHPEFIRGCCAAFKGNCLSIAQTIEAQGGGRV